MVYQRRVKLGLGSAVMLVGLFASACQPIMPPTPAADADAAAEANLQNAVEFEAIDVTCADGNVVISDSPFMAGTSTVDVTQEEGDPYFTVNSTIHPTAYPNATWTAPGQGFETPDDKWLVFHSGDGTGDLEGSRIYMIVTPAEDVSDLPCEPVGPVALLKGVIISDKVEPGSGVTATEFTDLDVSCPDGNVVISEEPLDAGRSEVEVTPGPEEPYFSVKVTQYPDAYPNATWVLPGQGVNTQDGGFIVIHQGSGTGDFEGDRMFYIVSPVEGLPDLPCEPNGPVVRSMGVIIQQAD